MRQAVLVEPKHIEFREVEAPKASDLKEHQVLLNIKRIGICGSEIHSYHGCHPATFYPVVQGHEYSAVVVATGAAVISAFPKRALMTGWITQMNDLSRMPISKSTSLTFFLLSLTMRP